MFHIGVDIGGTFTDCVLVGEGTDGGATYSTAKALSTKADPAQGVLAGLTELAASVGLARAELLGRTGRFGHGTTIGTNAVLERSGARVGVITTAGHGDTLAIMRGHGRVAGRSVEDVFRVRGTSLPAPLIVPGAVLELHERVDAAGKVVVALDETRAPVRSSTAFVPIVVPCPNRPVRASSSGRARPTFVASSVSPASTPSAGSAFVDSVLAVL